MGTHVIMEAYVSFVAQAATTHEILKAVVFVHYFSPNKSCLTISSPSHANTYILRSLLCYSLRVLSHF